MDFNKQLESLNPQQLAAVITDDVPLRIIAGAGSGKTRVITTKIAYLIQQRQIPSWRILAVTFTNKAANEMKTRVQTLLGADTRLFISTFHALCYRILREEFAHIGLEKNFTIIDVAEQKAIIKRIVKELDVPVKEQIKVVKSALYKIDNFKNEFISPSEANQDQTLLSPDDRLAVKIYGLYEETLKLENYVDFNDLQLKTHSLFEQNKDILKKWVSRFDYILVDEFQDTNNLQFELIKMLTAKRNNLTVVGDPDQTIYSWRGAQVNIILNFNKTYPNAKTVVLDKNYRSTKQILSVANNAISKNTQRENKVIHSDSDGEKVTVYEAKSTIGEANFVVEKIKEYVQEKKYEYRDFFIIYRMNAWSQTFETALENSKIPFQLVGGFKFRERKVIKDAIAYLRAISIKDNLAVERVLRETPKIGETTIEKVINMAKTHNYSIYELLTVHQDESLTISKHLKTVGDLLILGNQKVQEKMGAFDVLKFILVESGYEDRIKHLAKNEEDMQNLEILYQQLNTFDTTFDAETYQEENHVLAFLQDEAINAEEDDQISPNRVTLLTIHAAKGLENKVVFLTGNSKDIFPTYRSSFSSKELEEERRAFYVALTRAEKELFISYVNGGSSFLTKSFLTISKFIKELDQDLYQFDSEVIGRESRPIDQHVNYYEEEKTKATEIASDFESGDIIEHILFGEGLIIKRIGNQFRIAFTNPKYGIMLIDVDNPALTKK